MEISPAIWCTSLSSTPEFGHPLISRFSYPLKPSSSSLHHSISFHQWRKNHHHHLTFTRSLTDDTTTSVNLATQFDDTAADASLQLKRKATDISADLKGTSLFLVGMNSAMKSRVGKLIADELRYYYFDSDSLVEEAAGDDGSGKSFRERDVDGFRASETEVLKQLSSLGRLVVNAGNGAVQSVTNLSLLRHGILIWMDVPLDIIAKEFMTNAEQSEMSNVSTSDSFSQALDQLIPLYEENRGGYATADATVSLQSVASKLAYDEVEQVTAEDMALEVLKQIEKLTRMKKMMEEAGKPF